MTQDLHALTGAYALDALDPLEAELFEEHLDHCAACRREVAEFQATASQLGDAVATTPPADLKAAVLERVAVTRQESPRVVALPTARLRQWALPAAAALTAIAVGLGVVVTQLQSRITDLEDRNAMVMAIMAEPDVVMTAAPGPDGAQAHAMLSPSRGEGMVAFSNLQPAPADQVFQLWAIAADGIHPMDLFEVGPDGRTVRLLRGDMAGVTALGVTMEPAGGSPQPTSAPMIVIDLTTA